MTVDETLFYLAGRYLDLNKSCHFTLLCFCILLFPFFFWCVRFVLILRTGGQASGQTSGQRAGLTNSTPAPLRAEDITFSQRPNPFLKSTQTPRKRRTWFFFIVIIILFVMVIIMYNVKFPLFYFAFFFFWKSVLSLFGNCFLWTKSPIPVY